jgi:hypothetical protein
MRNRRGRGRRRYHLARLIALEATYFGLESGKRTAFFVFNMEDSHQCPEIAEAFFDTGCDVHLSPCMTPDDLQKGLGVAGLTARG